ncbi:MAG: hypothetical protein ABEN55_00185, partial [Bradymonadaceae bacterium]
DGWDQDDDQSIGQTEFVDGVFDVWNDDADDQLTSQEWQEAHTAWYREDQKHGSFADWDADGNGTLNQPEVQTGIIQTNLFSDWDHDGDDQIGENEFFEHAFAVWDGDDNGTIEESEWTESIEEWEPTERRPQVVRANR